MTIRLISSLASLAAIALATSATAQSIDQREIRQHVRIEEALAAGQLTNAQAQQLTSAEKHLLRVEARMRWQYGGDLSPMQRHALQLLADQDSAAIYRMTHASARTDVRSR